MRTNVLRKPLTCCCRKPMTGFYRDGYCRTGPGDVGLHTVCIEATHEFLNFSYLSGNDLTAPAPEWDFPGLKPGDRWCLCVTRWKQALDAGCAPPVLPAQKQQRCRNREKIFCLQLLLLRRSGQ